MIVGWTVSIWCSGSAASPSWLTATAAEVDIAVIAPPLSSREFPTTETAPELSPATGT